MTCYFRAGSILYSSEIVTKIDCTNIEKLIVRLHLLTNEIIEITGLDAIDVVMNAKSSVIEGKRFSFRKGAWIIHNILGHPLMQLFALIRLYKIAIWIHEITIPRPYGMKTKQLDNGWSGEKGISAYHSAASWKHHSKRRKQWIPK